MGRKWYLLGMHHCKSVWSLKWKRVPPTFSSHFPFLSQGILLSVVVFAFSLFWKYPIFLNILSYSRLIYIPNSNQSSVLVDFAASFNLRHFTKIDEQFVHHIPDLRILLDMTRKVLSSFSLIELYFFSVKIYSEELFYTVFLIWIKVAIRDPKTF